MRSVLGVHCKDWCWSWNASTLATSWEELTNWKRLWCWEGLGAGGEGEDRGWDGWTASLTRWTWVWVNSGSWWWTRRPGVLQFMGSQRVGHDWATELNRRVNQANSTNREEASPADFPLESRVYWFIYKYGKHFFLMLGVEVYYLCMLIIKKTCNWKNTLLIIKRCEVKFIFCLVIVSESDNLFELQFLYP